MSKKQKSEKGSALVETAIGSVVMVMLIIGIFDFGRIHYTRSSLKHAVSQSVRFGITGNTIEDAEAPGGQLTREQSIVLRIRQLSGLDAADDGRLRRGDDRLAVRGLGRRGAGEEGGAEDEKRRRARDRCWAHGAGGGLRRAALLGLVGPRS